MSGKYMKNYTFYLHQKIFSEVTLIGFKNAKSRMDHLVRAVLLRLDKEGRSKPYEGENCSCEVCESVNDIKTGLGRNF